MAPFVSTEGKLAFYFQSTIAAITEQTIPHEDSILSVLPSGSEEEWVDGSQSSSPLNAIWHFFGRLRNSRQTVRVVKYGLDYQSQKFLWTAYEERITSFCSRGKINFWVLESEKMNIYINIQRGKFTCHPDSIILLHRKKQAQHGWTVNNKIIWHD